MKTKLLGFAVFCALFYALCNFLWANQGEYMPVIVTGGVLFCVSISLGFVVWANYQKHSFVTCWLPFLLIDVVVTASVASSQTMYQITGGFGCIGMITIFVLIVGLDWLTKGNIWA